MQLENSNLEKIKHIVVLVLENRSFDQMLGYLYFDEGNISPTGQPFEGLSGNESNPLNRPGREPEMVSVFPIEARNPYNYVMPKADPGEGYANTISQLYGHPEDRSAPTNQGFVNDFDFVLKEVDANWKPQDGVPPIYPGTDVRDIMGMFTPELLPVMSSLAKGYAVCDHWYCAIPTETIPNRAFIACGTSQGILRDSMNHKPYGPYTYTANTIFNVMTDHNRSWKVYGYDKFPLTPGGMQAMDPFLVGDNRAKYFGEFTDFQRDVAEQNLADYAFLEPKWGPLGNSMHPNYNVANGEQFIAEVYRTLRDSELWNDTLLIITFDEHGGNYDHVLPPPAVQPNAEAVNEETGFDFTQFGVRVPTILISPYIEAGSVFRAQKNGTPLSHSSILATLEARFGLPSLTARDEAAPDVSAALSRVEPRDDDPLKGVIPPVYTPPATAPDHPSHLQLMHCHFCYQKWAEREHGDDYDKWQWPEISTAAAAEDYIRDMQQRFSSWH